MNLLLERPDVEALFQIGRRFVPLRFCERLGLQWRVAIRITVVQHFNAEFLFRRKIEKRAASGPSTSNYFGRHSMTRYRQKAGFATDFVHAPCNCTLPVG